MTSNDNHSVFSFQDPKDFGRLRAVFKTVGYTDAGVLEALDVKDLSSIQGDDLPLLLHRTRAGAPIDILIRLFLINVSCDTEAVRRAIRPMEIETWAKAGIVHTNQTSVVAAVQLLPFRDILLAYDLPMVLNTPLKQDYVMGIGSSTLTLANLTVRRHSRKTLDLGTGCGVHGLLAASHSHKVVGVDLNPRAVAFAAFNSGLNNVSNMDCAQGDLFEPIQGQTFDLVVTNPPFVISPEKRYIYRDGGMQADQITRKIVQQVPNFLNESGFCQILCNWAEKKGQDWRERLQQWFAGTGCDVWVMRSETRDAATYASTWIRHTEKHETEQHAERFRKWMEYYDDQDINAVSAGIITMRRKKARPNWFRADDAPEKMRGPCGDYILRGFELRDFLETMYDDGELLNTRLHVSPDVCLERQSVPSADGWIDDITRIRLTRGFAYSGDIDTFVANLVVACNGERRLGDLVDEMAVSLDTEPAKIKSTFCGIVRSLIERGFLLPVQA